jgi:amidase
VVFDIGGPDVLTYEQMMRRYAAVAGLFDDYDFLLAPSAQVFPFDAGQRWPQQIDGRSMDTYHRWMEVTTIGTLINAPVLALPGGFSTTGLPIGLQVIGRNHDDDALLKLAQAWEAQTAGLRRTLPPLLSARGAPADLPPTSKMR